MIMANENKNNASDFLYPEEEKFLLSLGYTLSKDIFGRDICSNTSGAYNKAVTTIARLLGYRDHWDTEFQKARIAFRKIYH